MGMPSSNQSNNETIFISSHGELVCNRKYCLNCLKQNYEYKHEHHSKIDWVCPFCQGYCYCIRCLRNEIINKLKGIFLLYGGDIQNLEQESLLSKYIKTLSEEDRKKKERDDYCNRKVNSSLIAQKVQKETYEKDVKLEKDLSYTLEQLTEIRFDMERVRLLVSQVCKREKIKNKVTNQDLLIYSHREKLVHNQKLKQQRTKTPPTIPGKRGRKPSLVKSPTKPLSKKEQKALLKKQRNEGDDNSNSSDLEVEEDEDNDDVDEDNIKIDGEENDEDDDEVDEELAEGDDDEENGEEDEGDADAEDEEEGDEEEVVDDDDNEVDNDDDDENEGEDDENEEEGVEGDDEDQEEVEEEVEDDEDNDENDAEEIGSQEEMEEEQDVDEDKSQLNSSDANEDDDEEEDDEEKSNNSNTQSEKKVHPKKRDDQDDDEDDEEEEDDDDDDENYEESNSDDEEVVVVKRKNSNSDDESKAEDSSDSDSTHGSRRLGRRPVQSQVKNVIRVLQKGRKQQKKETKIKQKPKAVSKKVAKAIQKNKLKDAKNGRFVKSTTTNGKQQEQQVVVKKKKSKKTKEINDLMRHHDPAIIKLTKSKSKLLRSSAIKSSSKPLARKQTLSGAEFHIQKKSKN